VLLLFVIFGLASLAAAGILLLSLAVGAWLFWTRRSRTLGIFLLLVPTLAAVSAVALSWGAGFWFNSLSQKAATLDASRRYDVLAFWAWPVGFVAGGIGGAALGLVITTLVARRNR